MQNFKGHFFSQNTSNGSFWELHPPIDIFYSNTVCNKSAAEVWICLVSFCGREWWRERLHFCMYFSQNDDLLHWDINVTSIFSIFFTRSKFNENLKNDHTFNNKLLITLRTMFLIYVIDLWTKNKMERRGLMFLQQSKIQRLKKEKKNFSEISNFSMLTFLENAQCFVGALL